MKRLNLGMRSRMLLVILVVLVMFALHNSFWLWRWDAVFPILFGFMPFAFSYYVAYALLATAAMALVIKLAWPDPVEDSAAPDSTAAKKEMISR